eukprot:2965602-Prymnesium_polylepis.1
MQKISLPIHVLDEMKVPRQARYLAFLYPCEALSAENVRRDLLSQQNQLLLLVAFGGFVYFDGNGLALSFAAFIEEDNHSYLALESAQVLDATTSEQIDLAFAQANRLCPVTLPKLLDQGALTFAWLLPDEFGLASMIPHGGFLYCSQDGNIKVVLALKAFRSPDQERNEAVKAQPQTRTFHPSEAQLQ